MDSDFNKIHKFNKEENDNPSNPPQEPTTAPQPVTSPETTTPAIYPEPNAHTKSYQATHQPAKVLSVDTATPVAVNEPTIPYLASLTAFVVLIISTFYSLISLINYALDKIIKTTNTNSASDYYSAYTSSFDNYLAISAVAAFCVSLPAVVLMARVISRYERSEPWRLTQKWRRGIYAVGAVVLIFGIVGSLTAMTYNVLGESIGINDSTPSSYSSPQGNASSSKEKKDALTPEQIKGNKISKAVISGLAGSAILGAGLFVLGSSFANRRRSATWITLGVLLAVGGGLSIYNVVQVQSNIVEAKKQSDKVTPVSPLYGQGSSATYDDDTTSSSASSYDNIERVQEDLEYYKTLKSGYPTKEQWDKGDFQSTGAGLSSETYLKTVTYTPTGCSTSSCTGYSVTGKNKSGKEETLKNDETSSSMTN